ncbi:hypothetical protein PPERSA_05474 [Pseudocohnilembus persalinus]|uniref:acylaminoacyl-peptidase n=1 Tax=Pseudocohnilembus persalinus TaxID=266149 RepID=A0A0V0R846_PSEPJ|nr:hypothetical protein PPERSA_05474 [Pseudocohnilembus persalinus]|eukprot:KRX10654.1 hypothetical protein PPERSA_05474 [Pseudocohnilembus persalinus]
MSLLKQCCYSEIHEDILNNTIVGEPFIWNYNSDKFLYIANKKKDTQKFWLDNQQLNEQEIQYSENFNRYEQGYGEQMDLVLQPQIYEYDVKNNQIKLIQIPLDQFPCFPQYIDKFSENIIYQAYQIGKESRYGIINNFNRESSIYILDRQKFDQQLNEKEKKENENDKIFNFNFNYIQQISSEIVALRPVVSYDYSKVFYFFGNMQEAQVNYLRIKLIIFDESFNIKDNYEITNNVNGQYMENQFMGVNGYHIDLKMAFWLNDNESFCFTTIQQGQQQLFLANLKNNKIFQINNNEMLSDVFNILHYDSKNNIIFGKSENPTHYQHLQILNLNKLQKSFKKSILDLQQKEIKQSWLQVDFLSLLDPNNTNIYTQIQDFLKQNLKEEILQYQDVQATFWRIQNYAENFNKLPEKVKNAIKQILEIENYYENQEKKPTMVLLHGGPHTAVLGYYRDLWVYYILRGYNFLCPNYSGSAGYGINFAMRIQQNIGIIDRKEIKQFIYQLIERKITDPKKIYTQGGGIFAGQDPLLFSAIIIKNPVLNLPFMTNISDMPDWVQGQICKQSKMNWSHYDSEMYKQMFEHSPMKMPPKIKVLQLLGAKDKRVPYQQGLAYDALDKFNQSKVETYVYDKAGHGLNDSLQSEFDVNIKCALFLEREQFDKNQQNI